MKRSEMPPYQNRLTENARALRRRATYTEKIVWNFLRNKQISGYVFHRQKPIGSFIADFYCKELELVVEVDGISHESIEAQIKDSEKDEYYRSLGMEFFVLLMKRYLEMET